MIEFHLVGRLGLKNVMSRRSLPRKSAESIRLACPHAITTGGFPGNGPSGGTCFALYGLLERTSAPANGLLPSKFTRSRKNGEITMTRLTGMMAIAGAALPGFVFGQVADPGVTGPARRAISAAAGAAGAPGVGERIESREQRRDVMRSDTNPNAAARANAGASGSTGNPNTWRYRWHNGEWWFYTPQNKWMYHRDNNWRNYVANEYRTPARYYSGYRGPYNRVYNNPAANAAAINNPATNNNNSAAAAPFSNGTPAGNLGSNLGADIGAAANTPQGVNRGAAIGGAIGSAIGAANSATANNALPNNAAPNNTVPNDAAAPPADQQPGAADNPAQPAARP